jgi:hypothetical protein
VSRIVADISSNKILQVEKTPDEGVVRLFNGRFFMPIPDGADVDVDASSYFFPQNSGSLSNLAAQALLARFPMYSNIVFNFLLNATDVGDLDLSLLPPVSPIGGFTVRTRVQTGRSSGPAPTGNIPNMTAILPVNTRTAPNRPGVVVTDTINIGPMTGGAGADEFLVWWHIYTVNTTEDITSDFGMFNGNNQPAEKEVSEMDQEPGFLQVFISHDDGVTWTPINRIEPTDLIVFDTLVRMAFVNNNTSGRIYLAAYAIMF